MVIRDLANAEPAFLQEMLYTALVSRGEAPLYAAWIRRLRAG